MELFVNYNDSSVFLELVTNYCNASEKYMIKVLKIREVTQNLLKLPELPILITSTGEIIRDDKEIVEFIAKITGQYSNVVGANEIQTFANFEFIKYFKSNKQDVNACLKFLNGHLMVNTFCNGFNVTIADIYAYAFVLPHVLKFSDEDKSVYCNVTRWVYHLQNLKGIKESINKNKLTLALPYEPLYLEPDVKEDKATGIKKNDKHKDKPEDTKPKEKSVDTKSNDKPAEAKSNDKQVDAKPKDKQVEAKSKDKTADAKPKEEKKKGKSEPTEDLHAISKLDIRVGKIVNIFVNTESEKLYNEEIDIGNGEIRKIASGLQKKVDIETLKDSYVVVLCNLKPRTLCGWTSHGMLLCCSGENEKIEPLRPPQGSLPGDPVFIGDYIRQPVPELNPKKNPWDVVKDDLIVNEEKLATFAKSNLWKTDKGFITSESNTNAKIS